MQNHIYDEYEEFYNTVIFWCKHKTNIGKERVTRRKSVYMGSRKKGVTYWTPITPQAQRPPAFPVVDDREWLPLPRSSSPEWTTIARPRILCGPLSEILLSVIFTAASPSPLAWIFPKSPTCLMVSSGAPCFTWSIWRTYVANLKFVQVPKHLINNDGKERKRIEIFDFFVH